MKKTSYFLFCIIMLMLTHQAMAQDSLRTSSLGLSLGSGQVLNKDLFQSPYTFKGTNLFLQAHFSLSNFKGEHSVNLDYTAGSMKSAISPAAQNQLLVLKYTYLFRLGNSRTQWTANLGAGVSTLGSITNYLPGIELPKTYLTSSTAITLNGLLSYVPTTKHRLLIDATLPMTSYIYRPDFEINGKIHKGFTSIAKDLGLITNIGYEYDLIRNYKLALNYQYIYFTYDKPRPITILHHGFTVGFKRQF